jgi:hypothetical protein
LSVLLTAASGYNSGREGGDSKKGIRKRRENRGVICKKEEKGRESTKKEGRTIGNDDVFQFITEDGNIGRVQQRREQQFGKRGGGRIGQETD